MIYFYALLFVVVVILGAALAYFRPAFRKHALSFWITFIASYMFSATVLHILPDVFDTSASRLDLGLYVLLGFMVQHFIVQYSRGVEHGHTHEFAPSTILLRKIVIALIFHALLEGLIGLNVFLKKGLLRMSTLFWGIALHKLPAAYALTSILLKQRIGRGFVLIWVLVFAVSTPLIFVLAYELPSIFGGEIVGARLMPFLGGMFLHLSTAMFFEVAPKHVYGWHKNGVLLLGVGAAILMEYGLELL